MRILARASGASARRSVHGTDRGLPEQKDLTAYNEDRHFGNFGILRDNHTGKILGPAPIFDNGLSLFNYAMPDDIQNLEEYARTRANPYGITYEAICRESCVLPQIRPKSRRCAAFPLHQGSWLVQPDRAHAAAFWGLEYSQPIINALNCFIILFADTIIRLH